MEKEKEDVHVRQRNTSGRRQIPSKVSATKPIVVTVNEPAETMGTIERDGIENTSTKAHNNNNTIQKSSTNIQKGHGEVLDTPKDIITRRQGSSKISVAQPIMVTVNPPASSLKKITTNGPETAKSENVKKKKTGSINVSNNNCANRTTSVGKSQGHGPKGTIENTSVRKADIRSEVQSFEKSKRNDKTSNGRTYGCKEEQNSKQCTTQSLNDQHASGSTCSSGKSSDPMTEMITSGSPSKKTLLSTIVPSHHSSVPCNKTMNTMTNYNNSTSTMRNFGQSLGNIDGNRNCSTWPSSFSNAYENEQYSESVLTRVQCESVSQDGNRNDFNPNVSEFTTSGTIAEAHHVVMDPSYGMYNYQAPNDLQSALMCSSVSQGNFNTQIQPDVRTHSHAMFSHSELPGQSCNYEGTFVQNPTPHSNGNTNRDTLSQPIWNSSMEKNGSHGHSDNSMDNTIRITIRIPRQDYKNIEKEIPLELTVDTQMPLDLSHKLKNSGYNPSAKTREQFDETVSGGTILKSHVSRDTTGNQHSNPKKIYHFRCKPLQMPDTTETASENGSQTTTNKYKITLQEHGKYKCEKKPGGKIEQNLVSNYKNSTSTVEQCEEHSGKYNSDSESEIRVHTQFNSIEEKRIKSGNPDQCHVNLKNDTAGFGIETVPESEQKSRIEKALEGSELDDEETHNGDVQADSQEDEQDNEEEEVNKEEEEDDNEDTDEEHDNYDDKEDEKSEKNSSNCSVDSFQNNDDEDENDVDVTGLGPCDTDDYADDECEDDDKGENGTQSDMEEDDNDVSYYSSENPEMTNHTVNEELNKAFEEIDPKDDYDVNNSLIEPQSCSTPKGNLFILYIFLLFFHLQQFVIIC